MMQFPVLTNRTLLDLGQTFADAARKHPDTPITLDHALVLHPEAGDRITVADLADLVDDAARRLAATGVRGGDRVAVYLSGGFDICILACALNRLGAVAAVLSPHLEGATVAVMLERLGGAAVVTDAGQLDGQLGGVLESLTARVVSIDAHALAETVLRDVAPAALPRRRTIGPDEPALLTHTSGTTGIPKLVMHSPRTLGSRYRWQQRIVSMVRGRPTVCMEVSFVHSRMYLGLATLADRGMPMVFLNSTDLEEITQMLVRHRPGVLETHPNSFLEWEAILDDARRPISSVRYFNSTFDAIHPSTMRKFLEASDQANPVFLQVYGQSECGPLAGRPYTRRSVCGADGRCQGLAMPGITQYRVVPRNGPVSEANPGYIEVRTSGRALGYWGESQRFEDQLHDGWWRGGDVGFVTRRGCLHLLDREVDLVPGIGSALAAEDRILERMSELAEVVIVSGPDDRPVTFVCTKADVRLDPQRWAEATHDYDGLSDPVQVGYHELPRTATAKIRRLEIKRRLETAGRL